MTDHCSAPAEASDTPILHYRWLSVRARGRAHAKPPSKAPLVVLVHGIAGSMAAWGQVLRTQLNPVAHVLVIDCLGFGDSPKPDAPYTPSRHVAALHATLRHALRSHHCGPIYLVGHSMGALLVAQWMVSFRQAEKHVPDTPVPSGAVLLSMPIFRSEADATRAVGATSAFNRWMALETPLARATCWLMCRIRPWLMPVMPRLLPDLPPEVARDSLKHTWKSYSGSLREVVLRSDGRTLLQALLDMQCPLLMLHGTSDQTAPADHVRNALAELRQPCPGAVHVQWVEGAHDLPFTHEATVATALVQFIQSPKRPPATASMRR